jgi:hypothetical protein
MNTNRNLWYGAIYVLIFDQITKWWALKNLPLEKDVLYRNWFSFNRIYNETTVMLNYDASFFSLSDIQFKIAYGIVAIILTFGIVWVINQKALNEDLLEVHFAKAGLFIILGALWGNLFDRVFRQGVVDFIKIHILENSLPIINIADIMIYVGVFSIIISWSIILVKKVLLHLNNKCLK